MLDKFWIFGFISWKIFGQSITIKTPLFNSNQTTNTKESTNVCSHNFRNKKLFWEFSHQHKNPALWNKKQRVVGWLKNSEKDEKFCGESENTEAKIGKRESEQSEEKQWILVLNKNPENGEEEINWQTWKTRVRNRGETDVKQMSRKMDKILKNEIQKKLKFQKCPRSVSRKQHKNIQKMDGHTNEKSWEWVTDEGWIYEKMKQEKTNQKHQTRKANSD